MKRPDRRSWYCRLYKHDKTHWRVLPDGRTYCYFCGRIVKEAP
jgi:hypothetical protein